MQRRSAWAAGGIVVAAGVLAVGSAVQARRIERRVPADGGFLTVDGVRLHYRDEGTGPAIVMIHGLGGQMRNFGYALHDRLVGRHRVILIDRPGSGYSDQAHSADVATQAALIAGVMAALGLERPLVVGHSLGGAVALALALGHPDRVGALALVCPLTQSEGERPEAFQTLGIQSPLLRRLVAHTIAVPVGLLGKTRQAELVFAPEPVPEDFGIRGGGDLLSRPGAFVAASADYVAAEAGMEAMMPRYPTLSMPVAILFGRDDAILDPAIQGVRFVAAVPAATLELIDGGHMIPVTRPNAVADWISAQRARLSHS